MEFHQKNGSVLQRRTRNYFLLIRFPITPPALIQKHFQPQTTLCAPLPVKRCTGNINPRETGNLAAEIGLAFAPPELTLL